MANPTVRANLKLIEELQKQQAELEKAIAQGFKRSQRYQTFIAKTLAKLLELFMREGLLQDLKTHRGKWKQIVTALKEVTHAENTEEADREGDNQDSH